MLARSLIIGFGIALLFPMLIYYGVATISPPPKYADFQSRALMPPVTAPAEERQAYNDLRRQENLQWQLAQAQFARKLIMVMAPLGIAAMLGGYFFGVNAIGTGLLAGGILCVAYGYFGYWSFLYPWMRFASLLAGFAMLLFIGARHLGLTWPLQQARAPARKRRR